MKHNQGMDNADPVQMTELTKVAEMLKRNILASEHETDQVIEVYRSFGAALTAITDRRDEGPSEKPDGASSVLDVHRVNTLLSAGRFEELSPREARFAVSAFDEFDPEALGQLLVHRPVLWRRYARQLLNRWHLCVDERIRWSAYAGLIRRAPSDLDIVAGPVPLATLAGESGARAVAMAAGRRDFQEFYWLLTERWRFGRWWGLTAFALIEWLSQFSDGPGEIESAVEFLARPEGAAVRALLLPASKQSTTGVEETNRGPNVARFYAVAALLTRRFASRSRLSEGGLAKLEPYLLRGRFGDPRETNVGGAWGEVAKLAEGPFRKYLESLVREDLSFFFQHAMKERDREVFWLRYVNSITRTLCVLDPADYERLDRAVAAGPEEIAAAFKRAVCLKSKRQNGASAFCLFFPRWVAVEFSVTGNACYIYERKWFEQTFATRISSGELYSAATLKEPRNAVGRVNHVSGWQQKLADIFAMNGVLPNVRG